VSWSFDSLTAYYTTDKRPAFRLESRPYRIGYNALAVLVMLPPLSSLDPLSGQAFMAQASRIQLLRCNSLVTSIQQKELLCINRMNLYFHHCFGGTLIGRKSGSMVNRSLLAGEKGYPDEATEGNAPYQEEH